MAKLTSEHVTEFLTAMQGAYRCPVCKHESFALNGGGKDDNLEVAVFELSVPRLEYSTHPFFGISCEKCGNSTFFHVRQIEKWLKEKG